MMISLKIVPLGMLNVILISVVLFKSQLTASFVSSCVFQDLIDVAFELSSPSEHIICGFVYIATADRHTTKELFQYCNRLLLIG